MNKSFSIGEYAEKAIHRNLKNHIERDISKHEVKVCGYIADICDNDRMEITEIQSKNFYALNNKIETYLNSGYTINVVYPVSIRRYLNWLEPDSLEVVERRKCPIRGGIYNIFNELYKIRNWLRDPRITFTIITLETEEYRLLDGYGQSRKNMSTKLDKLPTKIIDTISFNISCGYDQIIPKTLSNGFTSKQFSKAAKCKIETARKATLILRELGKIQFRGKIGREYAYDLICEH